MVLGLSSKNKRGGLVHVDYLIHIQEIKPWPPSQSLRSLRSVVIQWENGERNSGSTKVVSPTLGSIIGEGKIEFNECFKLPVTLLRDMSARAKDNETFQKNVLEFNLYEPRRDKTQLLATATIDLAEYGKISETLSLTTPMNCKRSFRNNTQPILFLAIQPVDKPRSSSSLRNGGRLSKEVSLDKNGGDSVSTLMNDEYASEEIASFTDDDVSSHSSMTASYSTLESSVKRSKESANTVPETEQGSSSQSSSADLSTDFGSLAINCVPANGTSDAACVLEQETQTNMRSNVQGDSVDGRTVHSKGDKNQSKDVQIDVASSKTHTSLYIEDDPENISSQSAERNQVLWHDFGVKTDIGQVERVKTVKSVRSSSDISRSNGVSGGTGNATLENKIKQLEGRIKMLEGELRETAAIEASLYSVVAEHGSSASKVHAPARRLSRLYLHACRERPPSRKAAAAKSIVSGLLLVAKSCGNDVPRLTYWLSNCIVLRTIVSQANGEADEPVSTGLYAHKQNSGSKKKESLWERQVSSPNRNGGKDTTYERLGDWDDLHTLTRALEKAEAWTFSRIVESIWWQTLTPCMQSAAAKTFNKVNDLGSKKNFGKTQSSVDQEQGNFSLKLWKKAFKDAWERLCPVRAGGHECGCLPMLARLIMEQCVARLDVAMFNAILRDSDDEIPTDPVSDPIGDLKVLPVLAGISSFGSGAQLKNSIGNWSRWLTDLFGIDDDDAIIDEDNPNDDDGDYRGDTSFKSFNLLNALSDLMMLPKDMLLNSSIRKEVCPTFGALLIRRVLYNFVPDEFCPDPIPNDVLEALESEEADDAQEESITEYPCTAAPPVYSPPSAGSVTRIIGGSGSHSHLRRSGSSVVRKSYTSDDELDELNSPLDLILTDGSQPSPTKPGFLINAKSCPTAVRYELLRGIWMDSE